MVLYYTDGHWFDEARVGGGGGVGWGTNFFYVIASYCDELLLLLVAYIYIYIYIYTEYKY